MPIDPGDYTNLWRNRIVSHPEILGGKPIIKGTRLSVEFVTDRVCSVHVTIDGFLKEYTQVTQEDVHACMEYAATGAELSNSSWADHDRLMDEEEAKRKREWLAEWQEKNASAG